MIDRWVGGLLAKVNAVLQKGFLLPISSTGAIRPPEVSRRLKEAMLAPQNYLEDARYRKIVPNIYVLEVNDDNYKRNYQPIESDLCQQWQKTLRNHLSTTNSRLRSNDYVCLGPIEVRITPMSHLAENEVDIKCEIVKRKVDQTQPALLSAYLELTTSGRRWPLHEGIVIIGRDQECDVYLDIPTVQQTRLMSGKHAYIEYKEQTFRLFDGSPTGAPSMNGTFVNRQPVQQDGHPLQDGDTIIFAALDAFEPRPHTPGVVELIFWLGT